MCRFGRAVGSELYERWWRGVDGYIARVYTYGGKIIDGFHKKIDGGIGSVST